MSKIRSRFGVEYDEWTGTLWMRRKIEKLNFEEAEEIYNSLNVNGRTRNLVITEAGL